jgi:UDP-N-acetylmuramate: L-alanyl-gamma-D-glutamyl-meso-diaminopimelate ligase
LTGFREQTSGRLIAVFEPRSATASRKLHQDTYAAAFAPADLSILAPVGRSEIPATEKLDTRAIADQLGATGRQAIACTSTDEAIARAAAEAKPGDTVVVMSNGRFDDAPDRILLGIMQR